MGIPREMIPLVSETMQNATLISTDYSVKCSASQAIELGAQSLVFQHTPSPESPTDPPTGLFFSNRQGLTAIDLHDTTNRTRRQKFFRCRFLLSSLGLWILGIRRGGSVWIHATGKKKKKDIWTVGKGDAGVFWAVLSLRMRSALHVVKLCTCPRMVRYELVFCCQFMPACISSISQKMLSNSLAFLYSIRIFFSSLNVHVYRAVLS